MPRRIAIKDVDDCSNDGCHEETVGPTYQYCEQCQKELTTIRKEAKRLFIGIHRNNKPRIGIHGKPTLNSFREKRLKR